MKSLIAVEQSILSIGKPYYLWTFTTLESNYPKQAAKQWSALSKRLVINIGYWGVRVYEEHKNGHGLHVHVVTGQRFSVNKVRAIVEESGVWGRVNVIMITKNPLYVCKYLRKFNRTEEWKGIRIWANIGRFPRGDKKKTIQYEVISAVSKLYKEYQRYINNKDRKQRLWLARLCYKCIHGIIRITIKGNNIKYEKIDYIRNLSLYCG